MPDPTPAPESIPTPSPAPTPAPASTPSPTPEPSPSPSPAPEPSAWTDKWREAIAGEDEESLKALKRFRDPTGLWNKIRNQEKIISQRTTKGAKPAEGATPEEIAAWRTEVGLPAEPKGFVENLKFPDGRVLGDDDKPVAEAFAKALHDGDPSPQGMFNSALGFYQAQLEEATSIQQEQDIDSKVECLVSLRKEFGSQKELDRVFKHIELAVFDDAPEGLADNLLRGARGADGRLLGNNPQFMSWLASVARKAAPIDEVMPAGMQMPGAPSRLAEIRAMRDSNKPEYWNDPKIQAEEVALIDADLRAKDRGRKAA